jgi:hypothetical protein
MPAGNYYMGMPQKNYNSLDPYNYQKLVPRDIYPKFKENQDKEKEEQKVSVNLAKELEKQIQELQKLTKEAKEVAKKVTHN